MSQGILPITSRIHHGMYLEVFRSPCLGVRSTLVSPLTRPRSGRGTHQGTVFIKPGERCLTSCTDLLPADCAKDGQLKYEGYFPSSTVAMNDGGEFEWQDVTTALVV